MTKTAFEDKILIGANSPRAFILQLFTVVQHKNASFLKGYVDFFFLIS